MKQTNKRGFTLIELLVVIAIIGILSSVVLASLNSARSKGSDAAIKSNLNNSRAAAALYYDSNSQAYGTASVATTTAGTAATCGLAASVFDPAAANSINAMYKAAASSSGVNGTCAFAPQAWAVAVPLKNPATTGYYWCVDSSGQAKESLGTAPFTALGNCS